MATPIQELDRAWSEQLERNNAEWTRAYRQLRDEFRREVAQYTAKEDRNVEEINRLAQHFDAELNRAKSQFYQSCERIRYDSERRYQQMRNELDLESRELKRLNEVYKEQLEDLEKSKEAIEKDIESIRKDYDQTIVLLKEGIDKRYRELLEAIQNAEEKDADLTAHSHGMIGLIKERVDSIKFKSESDAYYHYAEMLVLSRDLSDITVSLNAVLNNAETIRQKEVVMKAIANHVREFINNSDQYEMIREMHDPPWGPYYVEFCDSDGVAVRMFVSNRGFDLDVLLDDGDEE